jgi:hypothetical protein
MNNTKLTYFHFLPQRSKIIAEQNQPTWKILAFRIELRMIEKSSIARSDTILRLLSFSLCVIPNLRVAVSRVLGMD